jgi:RNA methyltransferase, TrmH family
MITSAQNPKLKLARSLLGRPKERLEAGAFVAEGVRLIEEALSAGWPFRFVLTGETLSRRGQELAKKLAEKGVELEQIPDTLMDTISETETSQGILAVLEQHTLSIPERLDFVLVPDSVRDPGNLGTLLRTGAAAGVQAVLLPPETTDAFAPKVVRAGMGAHFRLPILQAGWEVIRARLTGLQIILADMHGGQPIWQVDFKSPLALVIGGEAEGACQAARTLASSSVFIPMTGSTESLNAGIAGSIILFEVVRQRSVHS